LGKPEKNNFLSIQGGYHGDKFEAMSVCNPVNGMHHLFQTSLPTQLFAPCPSINFDEEWDKNDLQAFQQLLEQHSSEVAAIILEPIVQGGRGVCFYHPTYLQHFRELCDQHDVLLICNEIATGFGWKGNIFAIDIVPNILCISKALSGGFLSFAATITSSQVTNVFSQGPAGVLIHGPTFMGNPLACAISLASLQHLQTSDSPKTILLIETQLRNELEPCKESPYVQDV
jgi:adenosylmethionine-8-amino-7-oxononanoate aminotransferase